MIKSDTLHTHLGEFLRVKRQQTSAETGVATQRPTHRRTPGLRREEIAAAAGISVTWYTRLEQGKDVSASAGTLRRLAEVLKLNTAERKYLFELAGRIDPSVPEPSLETPLHPALAKAVQSFNGPSYVLDSTWTARAWNEAASSVFSEWLEGQEKNLLLHLFLDPYARRFVVDWDLRARTLVGQFRRYFGPFVPENPKVTLADFLCERSETFRRVWLDQEVQARKPSTLTFDHPRYGRLVYDQLTLTVLPESEFRMVVLTPADPDGDQRKPPISGV